MSAAAHIATLDPKAERHVALMQAAALRVQLAAEKGDELAGNRAIDDFDEHYRALLEIRRTRK